jgi:hypothetical protein
MSNELFCAGLLLACLGCSVADGDQPLFPTDNTSLIATSSAAGAHDVNALAVGGSPASAAGATAGSFMVPALTANASSAATLSSGATGGTGSTVAVSTGGLLMATGGAATGGRSATGGKAATGGRATGGAATGWAATGGRNATGGKPATGGVTSASSSLACSVTSWSYQTCTINQRTCGNNNVSYSIAGGLTFACSEESGTDCNLATAQLLEWLPANCGGAGGAPSTEGSSATGGTATGGAATGGAPAADCSQLRITSTCESVNDPADPSKCISRLDLVGDDIEPDDARRACQAEGDAVCAISRTATEHQWMCLHACLRCHITDTPQTAAICKAALDEAFRGGDCD